MYMLADVLGHEIAGFAYPGGQHDRALWRIVAAAGFRYARTTENFRLDCGTDCFRVPTTLQVFPHRRLTYFRNLLSGGYLPLRLPLFTSAMRMPQTFTQLRRILDFACRARGVFHLWGHLFKIDALELWKPIYEFLLYSADRIPRDRRFDNASVPQAKFVGELA